MTTNEQRPDIYTFLPRWLRLMDKSQGQELIKRFIKRPQEQFDAYISRVDGLKTLISINDVPADLLVYMKDLLGFTTPFDDITLNLNEADLRKLLRLAIPLWKRRGTEKGLIEVIRLLTGRASFLMDWFDFRWILGETLLGMDQLGVDPWIIGGNTSLYDEYWNNLRIMDDGSLDRTLLLNLVELSRPLNEHIEVAVLDFRDEFLETLVNWSNLFPGATHEGVINEAGHYMSIGVFGQMAPIIPLAGDYTTYDKYTVVFKFKLNDLNNILRVRFFYRDEDNQNWVDIAENAISVIQHSDDAGHSVEATYNPLVHLNIDTWYVLRLEVDRFIVGRTAARVYLDADIVIDLSSGMSGCIQPASGSVIFENDINGSTDIDIDNVEIWRMPLRWAVVEASGFTVSSNWSTP